MNGERRARVALIQQGGLDVAPVLGSDGDDPRSMRRRRLPIFRDFRPEVYTTGERMERSARRER